MKLHLSQINWSDKFDGKDVNTCWLLFIPILQYMIHSYVPVVCPSGEKKIDGTALRRRTVRMIKSLNICWQRYRTCPSEWKYEKYKCQRNKVQALIRDDKV